MTRTLPVSLLTILFPLFSLSQAPAGHIAHYRLDNTATDSGPGSWNGSLSSTTAGADRFNAAGKATVFSSGSSYGELPVTLVEAMRNSFTLNFWMKTTLDANEGDYWYQGNALVDAEVCGATGDWGVALINGGKVAFGIGPSDNTLISVTDYNDDNWHFITAVRNTTTSTFALYVDGVLEQTTVDPDTEQLTAPEFIGLGLNPCSIDPLYTGSLDEVIIYERALTGPEVAGLFAFSSAFTLPLDFSGFTGKLENGRVLLKWTVANSVNNHHFGIEYSTDGRTFLNGGSVPGSDLVSEYQFTMAGLLPGNYFFRIRQVDLDGRSTYSTTINLRVNGLTTLSLSGNPVITQLLLRNPAQEQIRQYIICDLSGQQVQVSTGSTAASVVRIDVSKLASGYYLLQVTTNKGTQALPFIRQ